MEEQAPTQPRGFRHAAGGVLNSGIALTRSRIELLRLESDEAQSRMRTVSRFASFGLVFFTAGYALLLAAATHLAAMHWFGGHWQVAFFAVAAVHLLTGGTLLYAARTRLRRARFFNSTLDQFDNDRRWLKDLQNDLKKRS